MKVRTFRARSMNEALSLVKRTFGVEAVIIYTKTLKAPGLKGFFGKTLVEIAAASDVPREEIAPESVTQRPMRRPEMPQKQRRDLTEVYRRQEIAKKTGTDDQLKKLREEITGIKSSLDELVLTQCPPGLAEMPNEMSECYMTLVRNGVGEKLAGEVIRIAGEKLSDQEMSNAGALRECVTGLLAQRVNVGGPIKIVPGSRRIVAFIGPTGVGKTTTIAKLAANFKVRGRRNVALITIDTYRIAAVQQLQTIADIIKVPLRTVLTVGDLREALDELRDYELVIIDTAGRSQRDELKMNDLKAFMDVAEADEVHLVVSCTGSMGNMLEVIERFKQIGPHRLVLTKTDEAEALGRLIDVSSRSGVPVSYVTTGQDIPDDIELASGKRLSRMVWER